MESGRLCYRITDYSQIILKWFICKRLVVTCYISIEYHIQWQKTNKWQRLQVLKNKKMSKHKMTRPLLFIEGQICIHLFIFMFMLQIYIFLGTIFKMNLNTLVTKYTYILILNFALIIKPLWSCSRLKCT